MSKWLNKRQQAVSERLNKDARRTEADGDFQDLAMQTEATQRAVMKMLDRVPQFLHPNPNARVKAAVGTTVAKLRKTASEKKYPHSSGELATVMEKASTDLPPDSAFGTALRTLTDSFRQIEESEHQMDAEVQQNFLSPLKDLQESELKEIARLKKKLEGRRLDFDYKQRKRESGKGTVTDDDLKVAKQKYEDSKATTENAMMNLLNNDLEQVGQLAAFVDAYVSKTRATLTALLEAQTNLGEILEEAQSRPKREARPVSTYQYEDDDDFADSGAAAADGDGPCALAAYDFEAENEGELSFKEGQTITLLNRLDENWLEGQVDDRVGIFPSNYVEIIRDV